METWFLVENIVVIYASLVRVIKGMLLLFLIFAHDHWSSLIMIIGGITRPFPYLPSYWLCFLWWHSNFGDGEPFEYHQWGYGEIFFLLTKLNFCCGESSLVHTRLLCSRIQYSTLTYIIVLYPFISYRTLF